MNYKSMVAFLLVFALSVTCFVGCGNSTKDNGNQNPDNGNSEVSQEKPEDQTATIVNCNFIDVKPTLDGVQDEEVWNNIEPSTIELESGNQVWMKSYYDNDNVYFLFDWISPMTNSADESTAGHWYKDENDAWTWDSKMDTLSVAWDLSGIPDFAETGCTPLCHDQSNVLDNRYMGTDVTGDIVELWVWSPAVSGMKDIMASYIWIDNAGEDTEDPNWDNKLTWEKLPGEYGFFYNRSESEKKPLEGDVDAPLYIVNDEQPSGDAALVAAIGKFDMGGYILEVARPRNPSNRDLTHFEVSDTGYADYLFATAVHSLDDRENHWTPDTASTLRMIGKAVSE